MFRFMCTARGLTTSTIPYGARSIEICFDFLAHRLVLECSDGMVKELPLRPMAVADFYREVMDLLRSAGVEIEHLENAGRSS